MQLVIDHFATRFGVRPDFFSTQKFAGSLKVKGLIIHDEDDAQAPYEYSIPLQKSWPQSRLVTTKGLGHNLRSFSIVKQVLDFIEEPNLEPVLRD
jgi:pimeloyl-ACP methyl ester carboxylesterase